MRVRERRGARRLVGRAACVAMLGVALSSCQTPTGPPSASHSINPCTTGTGISCDTLQTHIVTPPTSTSRHRLVLFFNGSGAQPLGYSKLLGGLSAAGYHTIGVRYSSGTGTGAACPLGNATLDPDCHRAFRAETVFGELVPDPTSAAYDSPTISVDAANSVENRVLRLVEHLRVAFPSEDWGQFQQRSGATCTSVDPTYGVCDLDWSKVVLMGHSLGAGVALYAAKFHDVDRVGMISGPFDEYDDGVTITVAPWITEGGFATPASDMYGLSHTGENNHAAQTAAWNALGMGVPQVSVDTGTAPWGGAHQLTTSGQPACLADAVPKHNSTAQDLCTPGSPPSLTSAWVTLAGG